MRELKILLCIPLEVVMLVINILHSILAAMSTLLLKAQLGIGRLYRQLIGENETKQDNEPSNSNPR